MLFFFQIKFLEKFFQEYHQCQTAWIQIRPDILSGLIWVQTVFILHTCMCSYLVGLGKNILAGKFNIPTLCAQTLAMREPNSDKLAPIFMSENLKLIIRTIGFSVMIILILLTK